MLRQAIVLAMRMPDYQCLGQTHGALALCLLDDDSCGAAADLVRAGLTIAREHNLFGHDAIELFLAHARVELLRAERARKEDRATATVSARRAGLHALRRSRVVSHAMSAALRGMARLAWFEGNRAGAMQWWVDSLAAAERVGARLDVASTLIECGTLTADTESLARGHAVREELRQSSAQLRGVRA
jgi:post-segregation antitoxin (ccd killing protein)